MSEKWDDGYPSDKVSPTQFILERTNSLKHAIENAEKEAERAHLVNVSNIQTLFKRIDEFKDHYIQIVRENEQIKTVISERTSHIERDFEKKIYELRDGQTTLKVQMAIVSVVSSAVVVAVTQILVTRFMGK